MLGLGFTGLTITRRRNVTPIRVAQYMGYIATNILAASSSRRAFVARVPVYLGSCDWSALGLLCNGWYGLGTNIGNGYTVTRAALEFGGAWTPITTSGGESLTVANGATEMMTDLVSPAPIFAGNAPRNSMPYLRCMGYLDSPTGTFALTPTASNGGEVWVYNPDTTTPLSDAYGSGAINSTGLTAFGAGVSLPIPAILIGRPAGAEAAVVMGLGDSIMRSDPAGVTIYGRATSSGGWFHRGHRTAGEADYSSGLYAGLNAGISGASQQSIATATKLLALAKYCNIAVDEGGTNGLATTSITAAQSIWASLRASGIPSSRIIRSYITPKTTSSNLFVDAAGQTPVTGFGPGGVVDTFNDAMDTALAADEIGAILPMSSIRDPGDFYKWLTNGAVDYATRDGIHTWSSAAHTLMRAEFLDTWQPVAEAAGLWNG